MTQGTHKNQPTKYEYQGITGLHAIADHVGMNPCTLKNRVYYKGLTIEEAIAMGNIRKRRKNKNPNRKSFADRGITFIKRGNKKRISFMPNFTELEKLVLGIA